MRQYQTLCSVSDNHLHLICRDGEFEKLPNYIRHQGPWQVMQRGDIINLKRTYRLRLARYGFVLDHSELAVFKPEVKRLAGAPSPTAFLKPESTIDEGFGLARYFFC